MRFSLLLDYTSPEGHPELIYPSNQFFVEFLQNFTDISNNPDNRWEKDPLFLSQFFI